VKTKVQQIAQKFQQLQSQISSNASIPNSSSSSSSESEFDFRIESGSSTTYSSPPSTSGGSSDIFGLFPSSTTASTIPVTAIPPTTAATTSGGSNDIFSLFTQPSVITSNPPPSQNYNPYSVSQTTYTSTQSNTTYVDPFAANSLQTNTLNAWQQTQPAPPPGGGVHLVNLQKRGDNEFGFVNTGASRDSFDFVNDILK
jgi:hypothetical protein